MFNLNLFRNIGFPLYLFIYLILPYSAITQTLKVDFVRNLETSLNNIKVTQINPGIVKTPFYNNLKISPGTKYDEFIEPNDIANIVIEVLKMRSGSVIDEINLTSQKRVINFKSK